METAATNVIKLVILAFIWNSLVERENSETNRSPQSVDRPSAMLAIL
jgi:hypothetical protein